MIRPATVLALALIAFACGEVTSPADMAHLDIVSGNAQVDTVARALPVSLVVRAIDVLDRPVSGIGVSFVVTEGAGRLASGFDITDRSGQARDRWILGLVAGVQRVEARAVESTEGEMIAATFSAIALPDRIDRVAVSADSLVEARGRTAFLDEMVQFTACAFDRFDNLHSNSGFAWSVSDTQVATIDGDGGLLTPLDTGSVEVTAEKEREVGAATLTIRAPPIEITSPSDSSRFTEGHYVAFSVRETDPGGVHLDSVVWISSRDGRLGRGTSIGRANLSPDWHDISATAFFDGGLWYTTLVAVRIETLPEVDIWEPRNTELHEHGTTVIMRGEGVDRDGGEVVLEWLSSIDGPLGTGATVERNDLSLGTHTIFLVGLDDDGQADTASVGITVVSFAQPSPYALSFVLRTDGGRMGDYVTVPDAPALDLTTTLTIEAWVWNRLAGTYEARSIISKSGSYALDVERDHFVVLIHNGTEVWRIRSIAMAYNWRWYHVAVTLDHGTMRLYINGVLDRGPLPGGLTPATSDWPLSFGWEGQPVSGKRFDGLIDEVRLWNVVRTQSEIQEAMTRSLTGTEPGLVGYWRFDEGSGDIAFDATPNGNHGQLGEAVGPDEHDPDWVANGAPLAPASARVKPNH